MILSFNKVLKIIKKIIRKPTSQVIFIYLGPDYSVNQFMPKFLKDSNMHNWSIIHCNSYDDLYNNLKNNPFAIIIHYSCIKNKKNYINESIINIEPFIKVKNKNPTIRLALAVDQTTSRSFIKEVLGSKHIKNIVPCSVGFGLIEYLTSLTAILNRAFYCPTKIIDLLPEFTTNLKHSKSIRNISLTPRQQQIAGLLAKNHLSNKEIARILGISESSVKCHLSKIFKKHNISNRLHLSNTYIVQK